jgi:hypothetical protein
LTSEYGTASDAKPVYYNDKFTGTQALEGITQTLAFLTEKSGIAAEAPAADAAPAEGEMAAAAEGEMMMEGGDEMMAEGEMAAAEGMAGMETPNPFAYDKDSRAYDGWNNVAAAVLRNMLVNPVFGDLVKANALGWEYNAEKGSAYPELSKAAALVSAAAAKAVQGENNVFISGYLDADSVEAITDLVTEKKPIHFPFVTAGWGSKEEAINAFAHTPINEARRSSYTKVLFEVTGAASFEFAGCRQIVHRLNGAIAGGDAVDEIKVFQVTAAKLEAQTVEEWKKAKEATPAAAPVDAPAEGEKPAEDPPAEGGDAPAE